MSQTIAGAVLAAWLCALAYAQSAANGKAPEAKLEFEVASIKSSALPGRGTIRLGRQGGPGSGDPGRVTYAFSTIRDLIVEAYAVRPSQVSEGPKWLDSERFSITAKVREGATKEQVRVMLQNLLAERFQLALHRQTKEMPIYSLVVGAKGPKLRDSSLTDVLHASDSQPKVGERARSGVQAAAPPQSLPPRPGVGGMKIGPDGCPTTPPMAAGRGGIFTMMTPNGECMISNGYTMDGLARELSNRFDRPVVDKTGLTGKYDLRLRYESSSIPGGRRGAIPSKDIRDDPSAGPAGDPANGIAPGGPPSIFSALQEQLGLKLEAQNGPVELLVIDHVEKAPSGN